MSSPDKQSPHTCRMVTESNLAGGDMDTCPNPYPLHQYYRLDNLFINSTTAEHITEASRTSQDALRQAMEELMTQDKIYLLRGLFITLLNEDQACFRQCIEILRETVMNDPHGIPTEGVLALLMLDFELDPETKKIGNYKADTVSTCIDILKNRKDFDAISIIRRCSIEKEIRDRVKAVLEESLEELGETAAVVVAQWGSNTEVRKRAVEKLHFAAAALDYVAYHQSHPGYSDESVENYAKELLEKLSDEPVSSKPSPRHVATLRNNAAAVHKKLENTK